MRCHFSLLVILLLGALGPFQAAAQAPNSAWVYPSATGNLLYQLDERGQRITDFSHCGYRGGTVPLPNVTALIPQSRWVYVSPADGDDRTRIQAAINTVSAKTPDANGWRGVVYLNAGEYQLARTLTINASGVVLKGAGNNATTGTRLRATDPRRYTVISMSGSGGASTVSGTTRALTQTLVPAGARTFQVSSAAGYAIGHTVIVRRPSPANWIADIDMDQLAEPWTEGSKTLGFNRTITHIDGNWITVDAPLPQTFEAKYGGGEIYRYTWSGIEQSGIEDIYGISDYAHSTDENHAWTFIDIVRAQHVWVRNITAQHFGYSAVYVLRNDVKWLTVADSQCLDPISEISGSRRYSFNLEDGECTLFVNNYARKGRHDFVFGSQVPGPNAFVHCTADTAYDDTGPHHKWSVGGLFDLVTVNGNSINVQNRGNLGSGHGWAGAYYTVWNSKAEAFRVRNPPTARNWLVGSIGNIGNSWVPVGADPDGTYDSSGPAGKGVYPRSLYYGQLQQRMKWPDSVFREVWLGDVDQHSSTGGTGETVNCDPTWLAAMEAISALPASAKFDYLTGNRYTACTLDFSLAPGDTVVAASLTLSLRGIDGADNDNILLDSTSSPQSFTSLGWTPIAANGSSVRTMEVSPALLADGRLNLGLGDDVSVDFAVLHLQVQKAQPATSTVTLTPAADAMVRGGDFADTNYGTSLSLETKGIDTGTSHRQAYLRWDLTGVSGKIVQAKVRLAGTSASQPGNENFASFVSNDTWGETALTFNNKPTSGKLFAQWLPITGQAVEFDVTPQVVATLLSDQKLSLRIAATDNQGDSGNVSYASSENATIANRPQLILTLGNAAPTLSEVPNQAVDVNTATTALPLVIGDDITAAAALTVSGTSSNPALLPNANIVFGGSGANRTVTLTPAPDQTGNATITLNVSDGTFTTSTTFVLTVGGIRVVASASRGITTQTGTTNTLTNFTVAPGNHRKLVLAASWENGSVSISATWNGTQHFTVAANSGGGRNAAILYLDNPTPGTGNIVVTFGGNTGSRVGVVSLTGVAGGVSATATATGTSGSLTTLVDQSWVMGVYTTNITDGAIPSMTGPFTTNLYNGDSSSSAGHAGHKIVENAGSATYSWAVSAPAADNNALAAFVPMTAAPLLLATTPTTDATNVPVDANLVAAFSETIMAGTGTISLWRLGGTEPVEIFDVASSTRLTFSGQTLTIDPAANLAPGRQYHLLLDSGAIIDTSGGDAFTGISDPTAWSFTTAGTPVDTYADWIANPDFDLEPEDQDFRYDSDGDGIPNGVEGWFGTSPAAPNAGLTQISKTGSVFRFQHPVADPALSDVTGSYEWSLDLSTWHPDTTATVGDTTVTPSVTTASGTTTVLVDTTSSITPPATLFLRAVATQE